MKKALFLALLVFPMISYGKVDLCSCVSFLRSVSDYQPPQVDYAFEIPIISKIPTPNSIAIFSYKPFGHVALVTEVGTSTITVLESNFFGCWINKRVVDMKNVFLKGYYRY